ncbi:WD repeat protein Swd3 [Schizosaccharomyces cryophilus OY26]|uniref:WD repeat protein Swd3 n=1 Tax=Schizosaccharomyces cryophilus (strain OY26 / ATCC MYA-4695 / CBS 11777 / NBRC 106824 / NRRL Y48691) TaxID=653667 RepID=S9X9T6_SCHCR|nr:WD repeat protein Swd3 [Schizosaccharomyces cryophilus OY26]EPY50531.1 WD repeat protein Swd3 [Schizosaccharomyces cryophilus OY26]
MELDLYPKDETLNITKDGVDSDDILHSKKKKECQSNNGFTEYCTLAGHTKSVTSIAVSPDRRWIATASADATIKLWSTLTFRLECTLFGHSRGISEIRWASGGRFLASASDDKTVRIWDIEKRSSARCLQGHTSFVSSVDFNPMGTLLVSGSWDETVRIWSVQDGRCIRMLPAHSEPITSVSISSDGTLCASASYDGMARIWDVMSGQCLKTLVEPINVPLSNIKFSPNGQYLIVSNLNSQMRLWDYRNNRVVHLYDCHKNTHFSMSWDYYLSRYFPWEPNNYQERSVETDISAYEDVYLLTPSEDGRVYITDPSTKAVVDDSIQHSDAPNVSLLHVASLGPFIISAGTDPYVRVWAPERLFSETKHEEEEKNQKSLQETLPIRQQSTSSNTESMSDSRIL